MDRQKPPRCTWFVGQRVRRKGTAEVGTVVKVDGEIKVQWDVGTSYFRDAERANDQLVAVDD